MECWWILDISFVQMYKFGVKIVNMKIKWMWLSRWVCNFGLNVFDVVCMRCIFGTYVYGSSDVYVQLDVKSWTQYWKSVFVLELSCTFVFPRWILVSKFMPASVLRLRIFDSFVSLMSIWLLKFVSVDTEWIDAFVNYFFERSVVPYGFCCLCIQYSP